MLRNTIVKEIFSKLSGKYAIKRTIMNHGYGEGTAYFLSNNTNELLYIEELKIKYNDYGSLIPTTKEYKYVFENGNISKYFTAPENNLFYRLNFIDRYKAIGNHLCGKDQYNATYVFLSSTSYILNYQILGPEKDYKIYSSFTRI